jgi:cell division protein FtsW
LALFGLFAYTGMRIARRSADPFLRLLTATTTMWIVGQVFINVGYVIGLLPVTGLQLPLISAGGTSTATTLLMIGVMANAARHEPEAVAALRSGGDDRMNRLLRLPLPEPYAPTKIEALRDRLRTKPKRTTTATPAVKAKAKPAKAVPAKRKTATARRPAQTSGADGGSRRSVPRGGSERAPREAAGQSARSGGKIAAGKGTARDGAKPADKRGRRALEGQRYG